MNKNSHNTNNTASLSFLPWRVTPHLEQREVLEEADKQQARRRLERTVQQPVEQPHLSNHRRTTCWEEEECVARRTLAYAFSLAAAPLALEGPE